MIEKFITDVCKLLKIKEPSVSYDTSNFTTDTMMAQCNSTGTTLYITKVYKLTPDYVFSIAHELRHVWQIRTDYNLYFRSYQPRNLCGSTEEYNLQFAEIDANAFAVIIMIEFFNLKPQWYDVSSRVISAIDDRIKIIVPLLE